MKHLISAFVCAIIAWNTTHTMDSTLVLPDGTCRQHTASDQNPLLVAIIQSDTERVTQLLEAGENPRVRNSDGETVLHLAARHFNSRTKGAIFMRLIDHILFRVLPY